MGCELLLFDIGNTSVKIGLADARRVVASYTLHTDVGQTADNLGLTLLPLLQHAGVTPGQLVGCVASSVVPGFDPLLREAVARYLDRPLHRVGKDLPVPLENRYERPCEVGADRLVGAYAARRLFPEVPSILVVDFGTAVTLDCVSGDAYLGGLIFPWPRFRARRPSCRASIWTCAPQSPRRAATPAPACGTGWSSALPAWWKGWSSGSSASCPARSKCWARAALPTPSPV